MTAHEDGYRYAPADSPAGLIERGRGLGALRARGEPAAARAAVLDCLRTDTRWDWQVDQRHHYLAHLVRELALPIDLPVTLLDGTDQDNWRSHGLLAVLARTGSTEARAALRRYVRRGGEWWQGVLDTVADEWPTPWWDDLRADALRLLAGAEPEHPDSACWPHWGLAVPAAPPPPRPARAPAEPAALLAVLADPDAPRRDRAAALRSLGDGPGAPELLPLVPQLWTCYPGSPDSFPLPHLGRALERLGPLALAPAREWVASGAPWLAGLGLGVLAGHGTAADLPLLLADLARSWADRRWCALDWLADGLSRFGPAAGEAAPLLHLFWSETPHSYERLSYLRALTAIAPASTAPLLHEALWDCESNVRRFALEHAPDGPELLSRAAELRDSPVEPPEVRAAAARRAG
ncbi:hypothetical protein [Kitasatospora sp. NPDC088134]|uniref:hypothetical protein n=1 Tax=Kitasatospora sp. NPDC088134 TaxID=3364071 RepID=UPI003826FEB9